MSSLLRLMVAVVLVVLTAGPHVRAQTDSGSVYATARPGTNTRSPFDWLLGRSPRQNAAAVRAAQPKSYQPRRRGTPPPKVQSVPGETAWPRSESPMVPGRQQAILSNHRPRACRARLCRRLRQCNRR
jgi:hypothetical protein